MGSSQSSTDKFLDEVCVHVNSRYDHATIKKELADHIEDMIEVYGEEEILKHMGNPKDIGEEFNEIYNPREARIFKNSKRILILLAVILLLVNIPLIGENFGFYFNVESKENHTTVHYDLKTNFVFIEGNRYSLSYAYIQNGKLQISISIDQSNFSKYPKPVVSNLTINNILFEQSQISYRMDIQNGRYAMLNIFTNFGDQMIESLEIDINGKTLRAISEGMD